MFGSFILGLHGTVDTEILGVTGAAWLEQNGGGHVNGEQREVLAKVLCLGNVVLLIQRYQMKLRIDLESKF